MVLMTAATTNRGPRFTRDEERWTAVVRRDRAADGAFYYSVRSTGVYCRPSCAARLPRRENVRFHATCSEAERAGFRPCKRCRPNESEDRQASLVAAACRAIESAESAPSLAALARAAGMSRFHFHRVFRALTGVTPRAYADAHRAKRVRDGLARGASVTEAIYDAGYNSNGRFYSSSTDHLGMTPSEFRAGGDGVSIRHAAGKCWLGTILVAASDKGVCAILLGDDPKLLLADLRKRFPKARLVEGDGAFARSVAAVAAFVAQPARGLELPLDIRGTAFQRRVWELLRAIPPGKTASYSEIAARMGSPSAARAVASACAANALAVAIPCHRAIAASGKLAGYRWGIERKRRLLQRERG